MADNSKNSARYAGLRPWPKGVSGNPAGRPKTKLMTDALKKIMSLDAKELMEFKPSTGAEVMALRLIAATASDGTGAIQGFREIADRIEGKAQTSIELSGEVSGGSIREERIAVLVAAIREAGYLDASNLRPDAVSSAKLPGAVSSGGKTVRALEGQRDAITVEAEEEEGK